MDTMELATFNPVQIRRLYNNCFSQYLIFNSAHGDMTRRCRFTMKLRKCLERIPN